ncbi:MULTISPECIES: hypothetical protein [Streptomyces]|uniref:Lipoprotein n=1 Tax=Streptomyces virginiae TaxID=1961 RepID=A0ABQ3NSD9_STRVG|nr:MULTISPECIES: hypothetical protein [Streptomyces]MBP2348461.1 hypothetical protein [Streptomyces virginiae]RST16347.1 hypothetical protein EF904_01860 [Streptomyces sp. WAC05950]GGQ08132.1 hypothetical protein GCM10010215_36680 [Streptomyces virginiae]GHI15676.1 hypothetical protein Scinn_51390 [Streptomyces virginiae]GLV91113.1 hypothetical protein Slala04_25670 [Streptomyces lavendulae subsp. lavendulae]
MRKVRWAAAAAGAVLLIAGCGSGGDPAQDRGSDAPSAGGSAPAKAASDGSGSPDIAAVRTEIAAAATAAGFTERTPDKIPPALTSCTIRWQSDGAKVTDSRKSYDSTVATLTGGGWKESGRNEERTSVTAAFDKSGWHLIAIHHPQGRVDGTDLDSFIANDTGPACEKLFQEDLAEKTKPQS